MDKRNELRQTLIAFYAKHNPVRLQVVDEIVESWHDNEQGLFDALREKYNLNHDLSPKLITIPSPETSSTINLSPLQQLEYRCSQMEHCLTELFLTKELPSNTTELATTFRDSAAAFSEVCLAVVRDIKLCEKKLAETEARLQHQPPETNLAHSPPPPPMDQEKPEAGPQVHDIMPLDSDAVADKVISNVIRSKCRDGDILNIHPGIYRENILINGLKVQLRASSDFKGKPIVFIAADPNVPVLQISSKSLVSLHGLDFAAPTERAAGAIPLIVIDKASAVQMEGCALVGGGGGIMIGDNESWLQMTGCSLRECVFAGIYAKTGAKVTLRKCKAQLCEVAVRIRDAAAELEDMEIYGSTSDGLTCHGICKTLIQRSLFTESKENGVMLSPSTTAVFHNCDFSKNGQYGIFVPSGADFSTHSCVFSSNTMGSYNRPPPLATQLQTTLTT